MLLLDEDTKKPIVAFKTMIGISKKSDGRKKAGRRIIEAKLIRTRDEINITLNIVRNSSSLLTSC